MNKLIKPIEEYKIGDKDTIRHKITEEDVKLFAKLTGDYNPLHLDADFAENTTFKKPVVYGMLSASFISTIIGMKIPGPGALWTSQTLEFLKQVYVGDELTVTAIVKQISISIDTLVLDIYTHNQHGHEILKGEATVKILKPIEAQENTNIEERQKICLITGGTSGIGSKIAIDLAQKGYKVAINYSSSEAKAEYLRNKLASRGLIAYFYKADISELSQVKNMLEKIQSEVGIITHFVHCASPQNAIQKFVALEWAAIQKHLDIQLKGAYHCMKELLPSMVSNKIRGNIVFIGSIAADGTPPSLQYDYVIAKAALSVLAKSLAVEYSPMGIAINIVSPGMTETERIASMPEKAKLMTKMQSPARKLIQVEDVSKTVAFLLEQDSCAITGETIRVCGGISMI